MRPRWISLLDTNPGLRSLFSARIVFEPYGVDDLVAIAQVCADRMQRRLAPDAVHALRGVIGAVIGATDRSGREGANASTRLAVTRPMRTW